MGHESKTYTKEELASILEAHAKWLSGDGGSRAYLSGANLSGAYLSGANLSGANLSGANLSGAYLSGANLSRANLSRAYLSGANLSGANLSGAHLSGAHLSGAYLSGANLSGAYLSGANLSGANLSGAYLSVDTILETGETWKQFCEETVPALLVAGGKTLEEVCGNGHWDCHEWSNCPLNAAFGVESTSEMPILLRPRGEQFLRYFDAKNEDGSSLIPNPIGNKGAACAVGGVS